EAMKFLEACKGATYTVKSLEKKPSKRSPSAPFTTSTLQQEASLKLGYSVIRTMTVAQKLYEAGKISYMRTDSVNLSEDAIKAATDQIAKNYGQQYVHERRFQTKSSGAQEAHEAIRPTDFSVTNVGSDEGQQRLYDLIWKRAIASQMANAEIEKTVATIGISTTPETLTASGEVITFDGFLKVYMESSDEDEDDDAKNMLPPITVGQVLNLGDMKARQEFSRPPSRYTEASLVKKLEELGIGRPSTYAPTITTIQKREYVVKEIREGKERNYKVLTLKDDNISQEVLTEITGAEKNKLFPTNTAMVVNDFLVEHFPDITDFSFTSEIEQEFDEIATGKLEWKKMIDNFYRPFHKKVLVTEKVERSAAGKNRELGVDPKTGKNVYVKLGKFGAYVQVGENPDDNGGEKPKFASLRPGQFIENITLEDALELMKLPRQMGDFEEKPVVVAIGRFGPYVSHDKKFVSIPKDLDPYTISYEKTVELIQNKRIADANRTIKLFAENPDIQVLNGRFGPYIKAGTKNVKIPKDKDPKELTLEECVELAANAPERKGRFGRFAAKKTEAPVAEKKAPAKKAAVKKVAAKKTPAKKTAAKKKKSE
ncbi:MAG TPA: DNA topoisomerase, partial [Cyclobacteriaceae bacterium]|nr:DNA topoisomerase [Cyclobacteriaceae bacterium]